MYQSKKIKISSRMQHSQCAVGFLDFLIFGYRVELLHLKNIKMVLYGKSHKYATSQKLCCILARMGEPIHLYLISMGFGN